MPIIDTIHRGNSYPKCIRDPKPPDDLNLRKMLHYLKSFPVIVDPKDSEYRKELYVDGDGSFRSWKWGLRRNRNE